jgi:hypothetical protein
MIALMGLVPQLQQLPVFTFIRQGGDKFLRMRMIESKTMKQSDDCFYLKLPPSWSFALLAHEVSDNLMSQTLPPHIGFFQRLVLSELSAPPLPRLHAALTKGIQLNEP